MGTHYARTADSMNNAQDVPLDRARLSAASATIFLCSILSHWTGKRFNRTTHWSNFASLQAPIATISTDRETHQHSVFGAGTVLRQHKTHMKLLPKRREVADVDGRTSIIWSRRTLRASPSEVYIENGLWKASKNWVSHCDRI